MKQFILQLLLRLSQLSCCKLSLSSPRVFNFSKRLADLKTGWNILQKGNKLRLIFKELRYGDVTAVVVVVRPVQQSSHLSRHLLVTEVGKSSTIPILFRG